MNKVDKIINLTSDKYRGGYKSSFIRFINSCFDEKVLMKEVDRAVEESLVKKHAGISAQRKIVKELEDEKILNENVLDLCQYFESNEFDSLNEVIEFMENIRENLIFKLLNLNEGNGNLSAVLYNLKKVKLGFYPLFT